VAFFEADNPSQLIENRMVSHLLQMVTVLIFFLANISGGYARLAVGLGGRSGQIS
jgi:hypothetical protein